MPLLHRLLFLPGLQGLRLVQLPVLPVLLAPARQQCGRILVSSTRLESLTYADLQHLGTDA